MAGEIVSVFEQSIGNLEDDILRLNPSVVERTASMVRRKRGEAINLEELSARTDIGAQLTLIGLTRLLTLKLPSDRRTWINIPPALFGNDSFVGQLVADVKEDGLVVGVEVLESGDRLVADVEGSLKNAHRMAEVGMQIGMDDLPVGNHTLQNFERIQGEGWPISMVKIVAGRVNQGQLVEIAGYAQVVNIPTVVIENIETPTQRDQIYRWLENAGVGIWGQVLGQGWLWDRPKLVFAQEGLSRNGDTNPLAGTDLNEVAAG